MNKRYLMLALEFVLIGYFAFRSFDFLTSTLGYLSPTVQTMAGIVYVLATDISFLLWRHVAGPNASTERQHSVADAMSWLLMVFAISTTAADTLLHNTQFVVNLEWANPIWLFLPVASVATNLVGLKLYEDLDAEHLQTMAERSVEFAETEAQLEIHRAAILDVRRSRAELAERLAPHIAADVKRKVESRTFARLPARTLDIQPEPTAKPGANGNRDKMTVYNSETAEATTNHPNGRGRREA